ncbi:Ham1 family protein [Oesophagostomum dentatum]|uniref:Inosine triphosphate pyrophosphatase n=1 Tax=Oesophagostomum dentatum TaxID=61180 RepID=A0A0B1T613_OESDE|nr:Ham1 family protein [Oesophagostomum dentatum]
MTRVITFVTGSAGKLAELKAILSSFEIRSIGLDLNEYQGEPDYVAEQKAREAAERVEGPVLVGDPVAGFIFVFTIHLLGVEDTSLCFNAFGGLPGVYVKWFSKKLGPSGLYQMLAGYDDKSAYAQSIFAYTEGKGKPVHVFRGRCLGHIVPPRGPPLFGWYPCFQPEGFLQTFAEMKEETRNTISHRAKALELVIFVIGCTGTGKSDLGVAIAKKYNGEVISADSMQIYEGLDIATNKITEEEAEGIPHHMMSFVDAATARYNIHQYRQQGLKTIEVISLDASKEVLIQRLDLRVEKMKRMGLKKELEDYYDKNGYKLVNREHFGVLQCIGLKEFIPYLELTAEQRQSEEGERLFEQGCEDVKLHTRQYARRQRNWINSRFVRRQEAREVDGEGENSEDANMTRRCDVCGIVIAGTRNWNKHLAGKRHKAAIRALKRRQEGRDDPQTRNVEENSSGDESGITGESDDNISSNGLVSEKSEVDVKKTKLDR